MANNKANLNILFYFFPFPVIGVIQEENVSFLIYFPFGIKSEFIRE